MTATALGAFQNEAKQDKLSTKRLIIASKGFFILITFIFILQAWNSFQSHKTLTEDVFYPKSAISYLKDNLPKGEIFSDYGWGGYLIWKLPAKKVFIDGRMAIWRRENCPDKESCHAFQDYINIITGKEDYKSHFKKYNIDTALLLVPRKLGVETQLQYLILNLFGRNVKPYNLVGTLKQDGWIEVYKDQTAIILKKPQSC